ncbi:MAG: flavin oxidoreductase [Rhodobacterales bacterium 32-66-7]|nr:MAG: flavin oxidoreductase [Rhodobacterales bacterium 32-66-7]
MIENDSRAGRALRDAFGQFATGVTLITTMTDEGPLGFVANSFSSVSLEPPLVLWSPARASRRFAAFAEARSYAIHVLGADQAGLITRFSRGGAGFDGLEHGLNAAGQPTLPALARFDCAAHAAHDGGDHAILVGLVEGFVIGEGAPLVFFQGGYGGFAG